MEISYIITGDDILAFHIDFMKKNKRFKRVSLFVKVWTALLLIFSAINFFLGNWGIATVTLIVGIFQLVYFSNKFRNWGLKKQVAQYHAQKIGKEHHFKLGEEGIAVEMPGMRSEYNYASFRSLSEDAEHAFLYVEENSAVILPYGAFRNEEEKRAFMDKLIEKIQLSGGKL